MKPSPYKVYFVIVFRKDMEDEVTYHVQASSPKEAKNIVRDMVEHIVSKKEYTIRKCVQNL